MTQPLVAPAEDRRAPTQDDFLTPEFIERSLELTLAFNRALVADPEYAASIPRGATVVLLPADDDPEFVELSIALGLEAIREGRDVLFHRVRDEERNGTAGNT
jgi:hypothetical protein